MRSDKVFSVDYAPRKMVEACFFLSNDEELAYRRLCDMIYISGGPIEDDDKKVSNMVKLSTAKWRKAKSVLIEKNHIQIKDGKIFNEKCEEILQKIRRRIEQKKLAGKASSEKRKSLKRNKAASTDVGTDEPTNISIEHNKKDISKDIPKKAVDAWNEFAGQVGLSRVKKLTSVRRSSLQARIKDAGGIDGWMVALEKVRGSPGLIGSNDRGWKASFDWLIGENNFTKLMEGRYDEWGKQEARNESRHGPDADRKRQEAVASGTLEWERRRRERGY